MKREDLDKKRIPENPGVYFFLGTKKEILYIGRATSLTHRVRSYFDGHIREKRSPVIEKMVNEARSVEWTVTDSVLEAMLLEVNLIRTHRPTYNTKSKDDKSFNHLVITNDEFPRVLVVRGKDLVQSDESAYQAIYGPFPSGTLFKEALKIIRKLFQFYDTPVALGAEKSKVLKGKIDFNRQIGLYPENCTKAEYGVTIQNIKHLFEGKKEKILKNLEKQMIQSAKKERFEEANILKKKIFALQHIQDISLIKDESRAYKDESTIRIEAYDVAHLNGDDMVGVMTVVQGEAQMKDEYRKFNIQGFTASNDPGALREILVRRLKHSEWIYPDIIVVDGSTAQKNVALAVLKEFTLTVPVVGVVKDEHHMPKRIIGDKKLINLHKQSILLANAEAHRFAIQFHRKTRKANFL